MSARLLQSSDYAQLSKFMGDVDRLSDEQRREVAGHLCQKGGYVVERQNHQFIYLSIMHGEKISPNGLK